ncbi:MAG TPA: ABC transporter permease [Candidatus Dormibacteraeota bacterium]|nr:ABC transporter permease [Candidatus Dormibacteraeota bacterium]
MSNITALATLSRRRFALSARTPREIIVPLMTPILFALVIAPALRDSFGGFHSSIDYLSFVALGTVGLLVPLSTMFAGLGVIVDRESGAQRELLAAPIPRPLIVLGNLSVALAVAGFQLAALFVAALLRGADFRSGAGGVAWFCAAVVLFSVAMYGMAETLASRVRSAEEYVGAVPAIAIVPWFFAGALFPISALPGALAVVAKLFPLTHALAVMRYGLVDPDGTGLHAIWNMDNPTLEAFLSLAVVAVFMAVVTALSIRLFVRRALG